MKCSKELHRLNDKTAKPRVCGAFVCNIIAVFQIFMYNFTCANIHIILERDTTASDALNITGLISGLRFLTTPSASIIVMLEPVAASISVYLLLNEKMTFVQIIGE